MIGLPIEIKGLLTFLITQGFKAFLGLFGKDMSGKVAAIAAVIVGAAIFFIDGMLAQVPVEYVDSVSAGLALVVSLLSAFGIHYTYQNVA